MNNPTFEITSAASRTNCPLVCWKPQVRVPYFARTDTRGLLSIHHPWQPSRRGNCGQWSCTVVPPAPWKPGMPLYVSFYQSDNYCGIWQQSEWMGAQAFIGHRFKQLLVNDKVVWEQDVADDELAGDEKLPRTNKNNLLDTGYQCNHGISGYVDPYRLIDITRYATFPMTLVFRMVDKVESRTHLQGDHYQRFSWSSCDPAKVVANFQTSAYFGDVVLTLEKKVVRSEQVNIQTILPKSSASQLPKKGVWFDLLVPDKLPMSGYPVRCGVPFPQSMLKDAEQIALHDARGKIVPSVLRGISHWQDGSIRWLLCEFVASSKQRYRLATTTKKSRIKSPVKVIESNRRISLVNDLIQIDFGARGQKFVVEKMTLQNGMTLPGMYFTMKLNRVGWREEFVSVVRAVKIEQANSLCVVIRVEGDMLSQEKHRLGPFVAKFELWAGQPYVLGQWRVVNESDQAMAVLLDWSARLALPDLHDAVVDFGPCEKGYDEDDPSVKSFEHFGQVAHPRKLSLHQGTELSCRQERSDLAQILRDTSWVATAREAAGFVNVNHSSGGLLASMRWFAQEFPKGIVVRSDMLSLATVAESFSAIAWRHDRPQVRLGRGEAKTQSFALWLHDGKLAASEAQHFNGCVHDAPRLFAQQWFIDSQALEVGPPRSTPALKLWRKKAAPIIERTGIGTVRLGHREYWDTAWMNNYRDRMHQGLVQFIETGDARWLRYFNAAAAHNRDVDIIHYCPEHPDWIGNCHQYGEDHTSCGPMSNIGLNLDGLLDHYLLTGDPDSLAAARSMAEHVLGCASWSRSARAVGWPLSQVMRWYEQSGDQRFLKKAQELLEAAATYIEPRRGIFNEQHGSYSYRGAVPFMTGYLAFGLIRYHRITADAQALALLHLLAEGLYAELKLPTGGFIYSPFPESNITQTATSRRSWSALVGGLTGYLHFTTGKKIHAQRTRECYGEAGIGTPMDMLPTANWMLHAVARPRSRIAEKKIHP